MAWDLKRILMMHTSLTHTGTMGTVRLLWEKELKPRNTHLVTAARVRVSYAARSLSDAVERRHPTKSKQTPEQLYLPLGDRQNHS